MNTIDTDPELLIPTATLDSTANMVENTPTGDVWPSMPKGTNQFYHAGFDHENLLVIPIYNQAASLQEHVRHLLHQGPLDILIVDDHSTDGSGEIAEQLALLFPGQVDIVHQPERLGVDAAYRTALGYAFKHGYSMMFSLASDCAEQSFPAPMLRYVLNETGVVLSAGVETPTRSRSFWHRLFSWGKKPFSYSLTFGFIWHTCAKSDEDVQAEEIPKETVLWK